MAHKICEHTDLSGLETGVVEVVSGRCEIGEDCPGLKAGCPFAWKGSIRANSTANRIFADYCKELERRPILSKLG